MFELFAQMPRNQGQFGNNPNGPPPEGVLAFVAGFYCVLFALGIATFICHILLYIRMSQVMSEVSRRNRKMEPGLVWLNLVPMLNYVWLILSVLWLSDSVKSEYDDRDIPGDGDYGRTMGIIFYVSNLVCFPVGIIFLFMYRGKLGELLTELKRTEPRTQDDRFDNEPRRRRDADF